MSMKAERERLHILMEECAESIQAAAKVLRHGYESDFGGRLPRTNREDLEREIGHIYAIHRLLVKAGDLDLDETMRHTCEKLGTIRSYLNERENVLLAEEAEEELVRALNQVPT